MSRRKKAQKVRFLPYLPYGYCSKLATTIEGKTNPTATMLCTDGDTDQATSLNLTHRKNNLEMAKYLCELNYAKDSRIKCGTPQEPRIFRGLTRHGIRAMIAIPDDIAMDEQEEDDEQTQGYNGNKKGNHFYNQSHTAAEMRELLHAYATSEREEDQLEFRHLLLDSVQQGYCTPLSYGLRIANQIKTSLSKYSHNQLYNIWRLSHIIAMFRVNDHLTYLDRRPHNTGFAIDGITDKDSYDAYVKKYGLTMAAYSYYALSNWYNDNPGYFRIAQTQPDCSEEAYQAWLKTPAFYYTKELPPSDDKPTAYEAGDTQESYTTLHHIHIGLATGKIVNYLCYHGKPGKFKWLPQREERAKAEAQKAVSRMKTQNPDLTYNDHVDFALYFCASHHQFMALFERTKNRHAKKQKGNFLTDEPFTSMHAIPVNDSGTFLLWCLLEFSPMETEEVLRNSLMDRSDDFHFQSNSIYPLTYKGKRVFLGYTMDIAKINRALEDHLDGANFYIGCFPEQIAWYQRLMPGHEYL